MASRETILIHRLKRIESKTEKLIADGELGVMQGKQVCENARGRWAMLSQLCHENLHGGEDFDSDEMETQLAEAMSSAESFIEFAKEQGVAP